MELLGWPSTLDVTLLAERVLDPPRPAIESIRAALKGIHKPREALEAAVARGFCPVDWLESRERAFGGSARSPKLVPRDTRAVVALASDVPGVLAAEALAREFVERARPWSSMPSRETPVFWGADSLSSSGDGRHPTQPILPRALDVLSPGSYRFTVMTRVMTKLGEHQAERSSSTDQSAIRSLFLRVIRRLGPRGPAPPYDSQWAALLYNRVEPSRQTAWHRAIEEHRRAWYFAIVAWAGETLASSLEPRALQWIPEPLRTVSLSTVPNPFEPLAKLWNTGYALRRASEESVELFLPLPASRW